MELLCLGSSDLAAKLFPPLSFDMYAWLKTREHDGLACDDAKLASYFLQIFAPMPGSMYMFI
jgi:hypothetical protein